MLFRFLDAKTDMLAVEEMSELLRSRVINDYESALEALGQTGLC